MCSHPVQALKVCTRCVMRCLRLTDKTLHRHLAASPRGLRQKKRGPSVSSVAGGSAVIFRFELACIFSALLCITNVVYQPCLWLEGLVFNDVGT